MKRTDTESIKKVAEHSEPAVATMAPEAKCFVWDCRGTGQGGVCPTMTGDHENRVTDYTAICVGNGQLHQTDMGDKTDALNCMHDQQAVIHAAKPPRKYIVRRLTPLECCRLQGFPDWWIEGCEQYPVDSVWAKSDALRYIDPRGKINGSDSAQYRLWGNGMALPNMLFVMRRIAEVSHDQA